MARRRHVRRPILAPADDHIDLVPLIDCVFLLLLFFMLCGRLSTDNRTEQISVPPTMTANKVQAKGWGREVINVFGSTQAGNPPRNTIWLGSHKFAAPGHTLEQTGADNYAGYVALRKVFNEIYDRAEKYRDPNLNLPDDQRMNLPKVVVEIRADSETEFRVVQEIQQVLTDTIDPASMQPRNVPNNQLKAFVNLEFTTRAVVATAAAP